ncbi:hypothetical protein DCO58_11775 [Helicobacter saguini]|uniref:Uncharacterized protein n=1 Tax=Helicobacter saguini TaxID=1548018 RepID=A0A347VQ91_9HELI|nr:hypothetical protein [Helicobacter saguini]MWV61032.1 hypothetical protein [Helicobacter saguini]MWV68299.1 hypothetical protein [Helicobacter saguini]MWV70236.1 hypothetical protein [Helicobacter saguini]MWV72139.1 hypothetical protein [Helicobacter saguini]TLD91640.1 hypothetical protein LS64_011660 [Helicobacter saguini]
MAKEKVIYFDSGEFINEQTGEKNRFIISRDKQECNNETLLKALCKMIDCTYEDYFETYEEYFKRLNSVVDTIKENKEICMNNIILLYNNINKFGDAFYYMCEATNEFHIDLDHDKLFLFLMKYYFEKVISRTEKRNLSKAEDREKEKKDLRDFVRYKKPKKG